MKMQEVITQLREIAPGVALNTESALNDFDQLRLMLTDALRANSVESVRALVKSCSDKAESVRLALEWARNKAGQLQQVNAAYKERLGPRGPKKPKDAPGQQMLPGIGGEGGTPTTIGETTMNDTSTTGGRATPSFIHSGRHG